MKKILFLLFAAAAFAACNDDGEPKVRYATTNDGIENGYLQGANLHFYGTSNVVCNLEEQSDKSISLTMKNVKFTDSPREPVKTIVFPKLACRNDGGTTHFESAGTIVPEIDGAPYEDYRISDFECRLTENASTFHLAFICVNANHHLNHTAAFDGTIIQ